MHLNTDQLVDIAEGTTLESSVPHLAGCAPCRAQVEELRAMMAVARDADVPEPSPLFWDHLSSRVRDAVAADARRPSRTFLGFLGTRTLQTGALVAAGVLLAVTLGLRTPAPATINGPINAPINAPGVALAVATAPAELLNDAASGDDASLTLVAGLTDDMDLDGVREAGLAQGGSAEHAVTHLSDGELRELGRLLQAELARPGA